MSSRDNLSYVTDLLQNLLLTMRHLPAILELLVLLAELLAHTFCFSQDRHMSITELTRIPSHYLRAVPFIVRDRKLLSYCLIPYAIGLLSFVACLTFLFAEEQSLMSLIFGEIEGWLRYLLHVVTVIIVLAASGLISIIVLSASGAWFIESFIQQSLREVELYTDDSSSQVGVLKSTLRGLRDDGIRLIYVSFILILSIACSFFPPLLFIPVLLGAFLVGFDLVDLPLTILGYDFSSRWIMVKRHILRVTALGACFSLVMLIPIAGMFMLPVAYQAAIFSIQSWTLEPLESKIPGSAAPSGSEK